MRVMSVLLRFRFAFRDVNRLFTNTVGDPWERHNWGDSRNFQGFLGVTGHHFEINAPMDAGFTPKTR